MYRESSKISLIGSVFRAAWIQIAATIREYPDPSRNAVHLCLCLIRWLWQAYIFCGINPSTTPEVRTISEFRLWYAGSNTTVRYLSGNMTVGYAFSCLRRQTELAVVLRDLAVGNMFINRKQIYYEY